MKWADPLRKPPATSGLMGAGGNFRGDFRFYDRRYAFDGVSWRRAVVSAYSSKYTWYPTVVNGGWEIL